METSEPLEGAAVLAVYYTEEYTAGGLRSQFLDAQETVTDKKGEFQIPSLNSFIFRTFQKFDPNVWFSIFKPGYGSFPEHPRTLVNTMPVRNGILLPDQHSRISLPKLRQDEIFLSPSVNFDIPYKKQKKFIDTLNEWNGRIGSGQYPEKAFERR